MIVFFRLFRHFVQKSSPIGRGFLGNKMSSAEALAEADFITLLIVFSFFER